MRLVYARATALAVILLAGWLAAACSPSGTAQAKDVQFPDPKAATGPYTLVHFSADW